MALIKAATLKAKLSRNCVTYMAIKKSRMSPYPKGNGQGERFNRALHEHELLRILPQRRGDDAQIIFPKCCMHTMPPHMH